VGATDHLGQTNYADIYILLTTNISRLMQFSQIHKIMHGLARNIRNML